MTTINQSIYRLSKFCKNTVFIQITIVSLMPDK